MQQLHIDEMVRRLKPVLKDETKAKAILNRYWRSRIALVWSVEDVHRAANERVVALTNQGAADALGSPQQAIRHELARFGHPD